MRTLPHASIPLRLRRARLAQLGALSVSAAMMAFILGRGAGNPSPWALVAFAAVLALPLLILLPLGQSALLRPLKALRHRLPWFDAEVVTWCRPEQLGDLRAALQAEGVPVLEFDGATMCDVDSALAVVEARLGVRSFPAEPIARLVAILGKEDKGTKLRAVVWTHAEAIAQRDPASLFGIVKRFEQQLGMSQTTTLLFVAAPQPALRQGAQHAVPIVRGEGAEGREQPSREVLDEAPGDAWWKPQPGELTK